VKQNPNQVTYSVSLCTMGVH